MRAALNIDPLLDAANDSWPDWTVGEPVLAPFRCEADVAAWRRDANWQDDREVLLALGRLTLLEGSRLEATAVLVAVCLPACEAAVALRARHSGDWGHVAEVAAGYLWEAVAEYPWEDPLRGWIPQGVARRVGRALDREFGWGESAERVWRDRMLLQPGQLDALVSVEMPELDVDPVSKSDVCVWALTEGGISREDLDLLIALAVTASEDGAPSRSSAGVTSRSACLHLVEPGQSADQLQYRARRALKVLREAARTHAA